jgi:UbiD family decarboxylase
VSYIDLREFIRQVADLHALRRIAGADSKFEIGGITEVAAGLADCPALLFEQIKGYPTGFRVFTNATTSPQRAALALGIDPALRPLDALKVWKDKRRHLKPHRPMTVPDPAFLENTASGQDVDLHAFPVP